MTLFEVEYLFSVGGYEKHEFIEADSEKEAALTKLERDNPTDVEGLRRIRVYQTEDSTSAKLYSVEKLLDVE